MVVVRAASPGFDSCNRLDPGVSPRGFISRLRLQHLSRGATIGLRRTRRLQSLIGLVDLKKNVVFQSVCRYRSNCAHVV
jgi:hypothetical protein